MQWSRNKASGLWGKNIRPLPLTPTVPDKGEINRVLWNFCDTLRENSQECLSGWTQNAWSTQHFIFYISAVTKSIHCYRGWSRADSLFQAWEISLGSCFGDCRGHKKPCLLSAGVIGMLHYSKIDLFILIAAIFLTLWCNAFTFSRNKILCVCVCMMFLRVQICPCYGGCVAVRGQPRVLVLAFTLFETGFHYCSQLCVG